MDDWSFNQLVEMALDELPVEFEDKLENVSVVVEDWPTAYQLQRLGKRTSNGLLLGLYEGIPQTKRGRYGIGPTVPDKITIFKTPIIRISRTYKDVVDIVKDTVTHEIAHHFGLSEEDIENAKSKRFIN